MPTKITNIFLGSLDTNGTRTNSFFEGDYVFIKAPILENQGIDVEIDAFLQIVLPDDTQQLIPLQPRNILDTSLIALIPSQFSRGNNRELYLFLLSDQPYLVDVSIVCNYDSSLDECCDEILEKIEQLRQNQQSRNASDLVQTVIDFIRLGGGDFNAILPLLTDFVSGLDSLPGITLPSLPSSANTLPEIDSYF